MLEKVICDQRQILTEVLGEDKGKKAVQTFIPYKEVLDLYDGGLQIPEDVTLIWVDDNFGYMRRYPQRGTEAERRKWSVLSFILLGVPWYELSFSTPFLWRRREMN